jgi:hypothetical protein
MTSTDMTPDEPTMEAGAETAPEAATAVPETAPEAATAAPEKVVKVRRRTIDVFLIWVGVIVTAVLIVAGALLTWGNQFAEDYVSDELSSQNISFPPEEDLVAQGRDDLAEYGGEQVDTGKEAEAYASFIGGHLEGVADGQTYADLGGPEREAQAALDAATEAGAPQDEIDQLQAEVDQISGARDTLFRGETLRGLLLSTYAWSVIGSIAGWAALAAFIAGGLMLVLVILGIAHLARNREPQPA